MVDTLGKDVASTFEYAIQQNLKLSAIAFKEKPIEAVECLRSILGKTGFKVVEPAIRDRIRETFEIQEDLRTLDFRQLEKIAERNYLRYQL